MASQKLIKAKIRSTDKTRKVTKAMESISAAKMRKAQVTAIAGRSYAKAAAGILARVGGSASLSRHAFVQVRDVTHALYIVITSDKGLAGSLNSAVLKAVVLDIASIGLAKEQVHILAVGRKANDFFSKRGYPVDSYMENGDDKISSEMIERLVNEASFRFAEGAVDTVRIAYQGFISTFEQKPAVRHMLPLALPTLTNLINEIVPARGRFAGAQPVSVTPPADYAIEPSEEAVLDSLMPRLVSIFTYHALLESKASEHSARMVAMKSASDKAKEFVRDLTIDYNKARQAGITREVSEIIGGIEAMAS
jgi:F-type H+-transporting ATPase subunit gamma